MDRSSEADKGILRRQGKGTGHEGKLGILGQTPATSHESIPVQCSAGLDFHSLRPCDLVRLFNSTSLGEVINERKFYRHRARAGYRIGDGRRVDLFRYTAWLAQRHHHSGQEMLRGGRGRSLQECHQFASSRRRHSGVGHREVLELVNRQDYLCALTGRLLTPESVALDHIIPVCHGGAHCIENAQVLHKDVNRAKGTLNNEEFVQLCREVVAHTGRGKTASKSTSLRRRMGEDAINPPQRTLFDV